MNNHPVPSTRPLASRYIASRDAGPHARLRKKAHGITGNATDTGDDASQGQQMVEILNTAISSVELEPESLEKALSDRLEAPSAPLNPRLVAVAVALVLLIFIVDLIVQYLS